MNEPATWEPAFRLNTCVLADCQHQLHDGPCPVTGCSCPDGVGRRPVFPPILDH